MKTKTIYHLDQEGNIVLTEKRYSNNGWIFRREFINAKNITIMRFNNIPKLFNNKKAKKKDNAKFLENTNYKLIKPNTVINIDNLVNKIEITSLPQDNIQNQPQFPSDKSDCEKEVLKSLHEALLSQDTCIENKSRELISLLRQQSKEVHKQAQTVLKLESKTRRLFQTDLEKAGIRTAYHSETLIWTLSRALIPFLEQIADKQNEHS